MVDKVAHLEAQKQIADVNRKQAIILDTIDLCYNHMANIDDDVLMLDELVAKYEMTDDEIIWLYTAVHRYGISLGHWLDHIYWKEW